MRRNLDLATKILIALEEAPLSGRWLNLDFEDATEDEITYQVKLLHDVGLIEAINLSSKDGVAWKAKSLTWAGHDFLDRVRSPEWIDSIKGKIVDKGVDVVFEAIKLGLQGLLSGG